jgi:sugar/nucleoside kinase (ribokinase family)
VRAVSDCEVIGIGITPRDLTAWLDHHPAADEKLRADAFVESGGGPVPTALVALARFGYRCAFAGVVGDDHGGRFVRDELVREGVDVSGLALRAGVDTATSLILVSGEHRSICEWGQVELPLTAEDVAPLDEALSRCRALLIDARLPAPQAAAARRVREGGGFVLLDAGHPRPGVEDVLPWTDVAIVSHTFPSGLPDRPTPEAFLDSLVDRLAPDGLRIAGVTLGSEGCLLRSADEGFVRIEGHEVDVVDTTGAGDVFHGAFTAALLQGESMEDAARFANAAAALKCRGRTGRARLPSREEIRRFADDL